MPQFSRILGFSTAFALSILLVPALGHAGTWVAFGPQTFVRGSGDPTQVTATFSVSNPNTLYLLRINNGGLNGEFPRSTGVITLNGNRILGPLVLSPRIPVLEFPILLRSNNQLGVQLQGTSGSGITVQIIGIDIQPPVISGTISPPPNAAGWNNSDVTVSFTCSDRTSGVASCPAPVVLTSEGAHQVVSGTVTDKSGNKATTSVTVNLDKTPPVISSSINPPPDAAGWNSSPVTVSFGCSDQLSGIAHCSPPVSLNAEGVNQIVTGTATDLAGNTASVQNTVNISTSFFFIRNYAGKCMDYGPNTRSGVTAIFLNDCAVAHPIRVEEIKDRHEVILHAGAQVIGVHHDTVSTIGAAPPPPPTELALELQAPANSTTTLSSPADQIFALDGDSIILASSRPCTNTGDTRCPPPPPQLVIQIQNARGTNGSALVAAVRNMADSEFWDFKAIDGSSKDPTSAFIHVATNYDLWNAVCNKPKASSITFSDVPLISDPGQPDDGLFLTDGCSDFSSQWGRVILVSSDPNSPQCNALGLGPCIDLSNFPPVALPAGITLRGDRRGINFGPQLFGSFQNEKNLPGFCSWCMLEVKGDYVRITGLRLRGQSRSTDKINSVTIGISVDPTPLQDFVSTTEFISLIDHNDMSDWVAAAVDVEGGHSETLTCDGIVDDPATLANVRVERNFLHHNERRDLGYGVGVGNGGRALVSGNTFLMNRHAIAGGGEAHESYRAGFNLVLSEAPEYDAGILVFHDFDMHGAGTGPGSNGFGGIAGNYLDILENTFLGSNRHNFELRGVPCHDTDFHGNVAVESQDDSVNFKPEEFPVGGTTGYITPISIYDNQFNAVNPTDHLGVGDFDGDGTDDLFLATGAAWYYSPSGKAEWRFLNAKPDSLGALLFGDFDGDGRTDVVAIHNGQFVVSWGGISGWEVLNADPTSGRLLLLPSAVTGMSVGDFDGDGHADIFYADGQTWWLSYGGSSSFVPVNTSSFRVTDLRFGDFDGDGKTDVFGVVSNGSSNTWSYSRSATGTWADGYLRPALADISGLVVADFNGDGHADVAANCDGPACWRISYRGFEDWTYVSTQNSGLLGPQFVAVGHFLGRAPTDVLSWNLYSNVGNNVTAICDLNSGQNTHFCISPAAIYPSTIYSTQDMR